MGVSQPQCLRALAPGMNDCKFSCSKSKPGIFFPVCLDQAVMVSLKTKNLAGLLMRFSFPLFVVRCEHSMAVMVDDKASWEMQQARECSAKCG